MRNACKYQLFVALLAIAMSPVQADELFRDPTRPYTPKMTYAAVPSQFKVNAIIVSDERRLAIVNGRRVGVGDSIGGATVTAISKYELTLDVGGERKTLRLKRGGAGQ